MVSWSDLSGLPEWLSSLESVSGKLVEFARNPRRIIFGALFSWLVGRILAGGRWVIDVYTGSGEWAANVIAGNFRTAFAPVIGAFSTTSSLLTGFHQEIIATVSSAGIVSPALVPAFYLLEVFLLLWVLDALIRVTGGLLSNTPYVGVVFGPLVSGYKVMKDSFQRAWKVLTA